ncbi:LysR family transcriptional regulator [Pistricoccus aurantiacus]|uniref:LysR family transcriptional regulator n=1 Tax=Pistricoccus aurantiacus TaxID=1883414 RepID=A0A5B8T0U6_9GAMM|nr:LysR family transcriptional regulator [Pistricoccus aurantiacus]QEA40678.1 LysR family transcriptional regulator [Pistricoccus aurantiacus]
MLPELKIQQLRYVLAIVDEGGFHAAARRLHRTQPALSLAIKELEQRLGQALFEKGGKTALTPFGETCLPRLRSLVAEHDRLVKDLLQQAQQGAGHIDLATVPSVANRLMPYLLGKFVEAYPGLKVSLHDGNADRVKRMIQLQEADLGITSLWQPDEDFVFTPLMQDEIGVVCREDHPLAGRESLEWQELLAHTLIANGTSRFLDRTPAAVLQERSLLYISSMISLTAMLEAGIGITTLPRLAFPEEYERLRFIPLAVPRVQRTLGVLKLAERSLSPAAQAMEGFILKSLG